MKKMILALATAAGCTLGAMSAPLALSPPIDECVADSDCAADQVCHAQTDCVDWPNPGDEVCFTYTTCEDPGDLCGDEVCGEGSRCMYGPSCDACNDYQPLGCVPELPPVYECASDFECGPNQYCAIPDIACDTGCPDEDRDGDGQIDPCPPCPQPLGFCEDLPTEVCADGVQCGPGERCVEAEICPDCAFIDEDGDGINDIDCPDCFVDGYCEPIDPDPSECSSDADCGRGGTCVTEEYCAPCACQDVDGDGQCDVEPECPCFTESHCEYEPVPECVTDADCGSGEVCIIEDVCACPFGAECDCPAVEPSSYCAPIEEPIYCSSDSDCGPGQACSFDGNGIDCDCPDEDGVACECPAIGLVGTCEPTEQPEYCHSDSECGAGFVCDLGDLPDCATPDDPNEPVCDIAVIGQCVPQAEGDCSTNSECGAGEYCLIETVCPECPFEDIDGDGVSDIACAAVCVDYGSCQPKQDGNACRTNDDCAADQYCGTLDDGRLACLGRDFHDCPDDDDHGDVRDEPNGILFNCSSTHDSSPATPGLALFAALGFAFFARRRRTA